MFGQQASQGYPEQRSSEDAREYNPTDCHRTHGSSSPRLRYANLTTFPPGSKKWNGYGDGAFDADSAPTV
jgi:hypothetical protein